MKIGPEFACSRRREGPVTLHCYGHTGRQCYGRRAVVNGIVMGAVQEVGECCIAAVVDDQGPPFPFRARTGDQCVKIPCSGQIGLDDRTRGRRCLRGSRTLPISIPSRYHEIIGHVVRQPPKDIGVAAGDIILIHCHDYCAGGRCSGVIDIVRRCDVTGRPSSK